MIKQNLVKRGDIYYAELDCFGSEQGGFRPVLVIQNDIGNKYSPTTLIAPITASATKRQLPTHVVINASEAGLNKDSTVLLEQSRVVDKNRLQKKVSYLDNNKMCEVDNAIAISFGLAAV